MVIKFNPFTGIFDLAGGAVDFSTDTLHVLKAGDTMTGPLSITGSSDALQLKIKAYASQTANLQEWQNSSGGVLSSVSSTGRFSIGGSFTPTALVHLAPGQTNVAPLKLTSGNLLSSPEAGAIEFQSDNLYYTKNSGPTRMTIAAINETQTWTGQNTFNDTVYVKNDISLNMQGPPSGNANSFKTGSDGTFLIDTGGGNSIKFKGGDSSGSTFMGYCDGSFNYVWKVDTKGRMTLPSGLRHLGFTSSSANPTTTELPNDKDMAIHKNTTSGAIYLAYNNGGSILKVQLT